MTMNKIEQLQQEVKKLESIPLLMKAPQAEKVMHAMVAVVIEQQQQIEQLKGRVAGNGN